MNALMLTSGIMVFVHADKMDSTGLALISAISIFWAALNMQARSDD